MIDCRKIVIFGRVALCMVLAALWQSSALNAQQDTPTLKELQEAFASPDSHQRHEIFARINPEDSKQFKIALQVLGTRDWYDRDAVVEALSKAGTEETLESIVDNLKKNRNPFIRQGMAATLAKMKDERVYHHLYEALDDDDPTVRRAVAHSLRVHKKEDAVEALVQRFQKEDDTVVRNFIRSSLEELTQAYHGPNPAAWLLWWEEAKRDKNYTLGKTDAEAQRAAEELGNKLKKRKTVSVIGGVTLETEERGRAAGEKSVPVIVLPFYNYSRKIMQPFLSELEQTNKLYYLDLPPLKAFSGLTTAGKTSIPYYPIDKLVQAFEDLRKETGEKRFALMACGMSSWIAMRYASKFPKSVSHLVFIAPLSSNKAYGDATGVMERTGKSTGDMELWHLALTRTFNPETGESSHDRYHREKSEPKPDGHDGGIGRRSWTLFFKDTRNSLISDLYPIRYQEPSGFAIPDFKVEQEPKRRIPTLVIVGKQSLYTSVADCQRIAKHYGTRARVYENSADLPFAEEGTRFIQEVSRFLGNKPGKKSRKRSSRK